MSKIENNLTIIKISYSMQMSRANDIYWSFMGTQTANVLGKIKMRK